MRIYLDDLEGIIEFKPYPDKLSPEPPSASFRVIGLGGRESFRRMECPNRRKEVSD